MKFGGKGFRLTYTTKDKLMNMQKMMMVVSLVLAAVVISGCQGLQPHSSAVHMDLAPKAQVAANFDQVTDGMTDVQVRELLGYPTNTKMYQTGKAWIPFYFGPDTRRVEYQYEDVGLITLTRNQYTNSLTVIAKKRKE